MNLLSRRWLVVWSLTLAGVGFSVWDYRNYLKIETENYGHGPGDQRVNWKIDQLYENEIERFRIKYPKELSLDEKNLTFFDAEVSIKMEVKSGAKGTLKDWEDEETAALAENERMYGERSYENTDRTSMTVIDVQRFVGDKTYMIRKYLAKKEDRLYKLEFTTEASNWQKNRGNFREMARSLVLL